MMFEKNLAAETVFCPEFNIDIENYIQHFAKAWGESEFVVPEQGIIYSSKEKYAREKDLEKFLKSIKKESKKSGFTANEKLRNYEKFTPAIKSFLENGLGFEKEEVEMFFSNGFLKVTSQFIESAQNFDPAMSAEDISQALRNVWTINWIQLLLNKPVELTPSAFAYSMLYPYTDNYIDDPGISRENKNKFNVRLAERLAGCFIEPENSREEIIYNLIGMIESQFNRVVFPEVFKSLLAIHSAQTKSMKLLKSGLEITDGELLNISLEKGGTSVFADGYLVAGYLTEEEKVFLFGLGAYLQLIDDIQDISEDYQNGFKTIFTNAAEKYTLDKLVDRMNGFGEIILSNFGVFDFKDKINAFNLMKKSCKLLLVGAIGIAPNFYDPQYIYRMETHSPFHFSFLRKHQVDYLNNGLSLVKMSN